MLQNALFFKCKTYVQNGEIIENVNFTMGKFKFGYENINFPRGKFTLVDARGPHWSRRGARVCILIRNRDKGGIKRPPEVPRGARRAFSRKCYRSYGRVVAYVTSDSQCYRMHCFFNAKLMSSMVR